MIDSYPKKQRSDEIILRDRGKIYLINIENLDKTPFQQHLHDVSIFAQMCALTYVEESDESPNSARRLAEDIVSWESAIQYAGWEKLCWEAPKPASGYNLRTLKYEIWIDESNKRAALAFRGTAKLADWWSNAHWITGYVPKVNNHYKLVSAMVDEAIAKLISVLGNEFTLYTTGHSLGGGLAQLFAYSSKHKAEFVCAFHTTPVTGFFGVDINLRNKSRNGLYIARVFEHGEVLAYFRLLIRKFYKVSTENPRIAEFRTNFIKESGLVTQHSIALFANEYRKLSRSE